MCSFALQYLERVKEEKKGMEKKRRGEKVIRLRGICKEVGADSWVRKGC